MEISGKIEFLGADEAVSASFTKRDIVITTPEQYPQSILIQFTQDKCDLLDKYKVGDEVEISINLRGRKWTDPATGVDKWFNTIQGWKIKKLSDAPEGTPSNATVPATPSTPAPSTTKKLVLIGKGAEHPYEAWIASKWTDALLVNKGYAKWEDVAGGPATPDGDDLPF